MRNRSGQFLTDNLPEREDCGCLTNFFLDSDNIGEDEGSVNEEKTVEEVG